MTKTCLQCGAVISSSLRARCFCDSASPESAPPDSRDRFGKELVHPDSGAGENPRLHFQDGRELQQAAWREELSKRVKAHRNGRKGSVENVAQTHLEFREADSVAIEEKPSPAFAASAVDSGRDEFSFSIAIGRPARKRSEENSRLIIDVSAPSADGDGTDRRAQPIADSPPLYPVATIEERRICALIDAACLLFAYGSFAALFSSLGGQFVPSKMSAAVAFTTFAIVYLQYFALFTIFGGTTPGMMMRGLQVVGFSGESPSPRQMLMRAVGYGLSAGTFFLGFLWAMWDEDSLTWHDRLSETYLAPATTFADVDARVAVPGSR